MEANPLHWTIFLAYFLALVGYVCRFLFGVFAPNVTGLRWWWRLLSGVGCLFVPAGMLIAYQHGRVKGATLRVWITRGLIGLAVVGLAMVSDWSGWQFRSEWARDSMVGAVYLLSSDAATTEGSVIRTTDGDAAEVPAKWNSAIFLAAYGIALGALFLRNTTTAAIALGWLGAVIGAFSTAHFYAWCIDSMDGDSIALYYDANYLLHFFGPTLFAPWVALAALTLTTRGTSAELFQDATP
jgi:hypothetical protein